MRKLAAVWTLILLASFISLQSQNIGNQYQMIETIKGDFLTCDMKGNLFMMSDASLYKFNQEGQILFSYSNLFLGTIASVDVSNPLKIMVFYKDAGKLVFLDEKLTPITEPIDLLSRNYFNISLAAFSTDNRIWLYDNVKNELITVDFQLNELQKNHLTIELLNPRQMNTFKEKNVFIQNPGSGILFFDNFGTYLKLIPIQTTAIAQIDDQFIYYLKDNQLLAYNYQKLNQIEICTFTDDVRQAIFMHGKVFYLSNNGLFNKLILK